MSANRQWWLAAVAKAKREELVQQAASGAYADFVKSRLGGRLNFGAAAQTAPINLQPTSIQAVEGLPRLGAARSVMTRRGLFLPARAGESSTVRKPKKAGFKLNDEGARRFVCAIIEQAVTDFKGLVKRGRIANGQIVNGPCKRFSSGYKFNHEAQTLLDFFKAGGVLDEWLLMAGLDINPTLVRRKLGIA